MPLLWVLWARPLAPVRLCCFPAYVWPFSWPAARDERFVCGVPDASCA